ncbi:hypothetical protein FUA48_10180 [Flavobacterium alkalisoli]|uniref:Uncharacterized protein n=1 Tax=Flavobacterium alkalisoli TaxID=2602769 RepID=A0A5B9FRF7_9FLAO|nr:hypothetical protein [Flavobacterium alkalisoli]QEE49933.1 hypothetical protein FUA48_10180 [Flavobacterium alkalisoli]
MEENNNQNIQPEAPKRKPNPLFAIAFFYLLGFLLTRKGSTETTLSTIMLVLGWVLLVASMVLSVLFFVRTFKDILKKK